MKQVPLFMYRGRSERDCKKLYVQQIHSLTKALRTMASRKNMTCSNYHLDGIYKVFPKRLKKFHKYPVQ